MRIVCEDVAANREFWLKMKEATVGSSEVATICGLNDYQTELHLWARRTGKIPPLEPTAAMWMGLQMEPIIGELFRKKTGFSVERANIMAVHDVHEWASASPDFWTYYEEQKRPLETKFTTWRNRKIWANGIPDPYVLQTNWQLGVCGLEAGHVCGLIGDDIEEMPHGPVEFSKDLFEYCLERGARFLEYVQQDLPPEAGPGDKRLVAQLQGTRNEEGQIELPVEADGVAEKILSLRGQLSKTNKQVKDMKETVDGLEARLLQLLGSSARGVTPGGLCVAAVQRTQAAHYRNAASWVEVKFV